MEEKKLQILFVITQGSWGGAQRYVFDLSQALSSQHQVTVAIGEAHGTKDLQTKLQQPGVSIEVIQLKHLKRAISPLQDVLALFELRNLYQKIQPDIIHLNSSKAGILGSFAQVLRCSGAQVIYTVHGWVFLEPLPRLLRSVYRWLEKYTAQFKDALIVLSPEEKKITTHILGIKESKAHLIPLAINQQASILNQKEAKEKIQTLSPLIIPRGFWVGAIAGLYQAKGLDVLIDATKHLPKNLLGQTTFVIIGDGPEKNRLQKQIELSGLKEKVLLLGHIENAAELLPAFDLFVLPSKKEGLPYTLLEAKSVGLPIIATRVGGIPSLLQNSSACALVSPNNIMELAQALTHALQSSSPLGSRTPVEKFSNSNFNAMVSRVEALYFSVLPH